MTTVDFLRPKLCGLRFQEAAIPLEFLKDLAVLEEMVIEVAKWRYLQEHSDRRRSPRGFTEGIELRLAGVDEGSAVPVIRMAVNSPHLPGIPPLNQVYFEQAREAIIGAIGAAEQNQSIMSYLPERVLGYFDRIGRNLRNGESIEFTTSLHSQPARLTRETRRRLVLSSSRAREFTEEVRLRGSIPEVDQDAMTFQLQLIDGYKVTGPMPDQHLDTIIEAFNGYKSDMRILLQGIGRFNRQNRLLGLESSEHISLLDPLDVSVRLDEFRKLKDGWLEGRGMAPKHDELDWFTFCFDRYFPDDLQLPHVFPTAEGGIQAEWTLGSQDVSIEVDLPERHAVWHRLDMNTDEEDMRNLDLEKEDDWKWIVSEIRRMSGGAL